MVLEEQQLRLSSNLHIHVYLHIHGCTHIHIQQKDIKYSSFKDICC